jgi:hypothetical protein
LHVAFHKGRAYGRHVLRVKGRIIWLVTALLTVPSVCLICLHPIHQCRNLGLLQNVKTFSAKPPCASLQADLRLSTCDPAARCAANGYDHLSKSCSYLFYLVSPRSMEPYIEPNMGASNCQAVCEKGACVDLSGKHSAQLQCRLQILAAWMAPWYPIKTLLYRKCMQMQKLPVFFICFYRFASAKGLSNFDATGGCFWSCACWPLDFPVQALV